MPLDDEEWSAASPTKSDTDIVYDFLREHPSEAYSAKEIMREVFEPETESVAGKIVWAVLLRYVLAVLQLLIADGKVEERVVIREDDSGGETAVSYFRITERLD